MASLGSGSNTGELFFDGSPNASGVCVTIKNTGALLQSSWIVKKNAGTPVGTMSVRVYSTTGTPGSSRNCTPTSGGTIQLLATSQPINAQVLTSTFQNFTFPFVSGLFLNKNQNVIVVLMSNFTDSGGQYIVQLNNAQSIDANQNDVDFTSGAWAADNAQCLGANFCIGYSVIGNPPGDPSPPTGSGSAGPWVPYVDPVYVYGTAAAFFILAAFVLIVERRRAAP